MNNKLSYHRKSFKIWGKISVTDVLCYELTMSCWNLVHSRGAHLKFGENLAVTDVLCYELMMWCWNLIHSRGVIWNWGRIQRMMLRSARKSCWNWIEFKGYRPALYLSPGCNWFVLLCWILPISKYGTWLVRVSPCYILYVPMLYNSTIIELLFLLFSSDGTVDLRCTRP